MTSERTRSAAVVTVSDSVAAALKADVSGPAVARRMHDLGWTTEQFVIPDELEQIRSLLHNLTESQRFSVVLTTGGTGVALRDVTPEATRAVVEREIPGIGELMRATGLQHTRRSALSRATAGTRGETLILNLPGSPKGAVESLDAVADLLPHIVDLIEGRTAHPGAEETVERMGTSKK